MYANVLQINVWVTHFPVLFYLQLTVLLFIANSDYGKDVSAHDVRHCSTHSQSTIISLASITFCKTKTRNDGCCKILSAILNLRGLISSSPSSSDIKHNFSLTTKLLDDFRTTCQWRLPPPLRESIEEWMLTKLKHPLELLCLLRGILSSSISLLYVTNLPPNPSYSTPISLYVASNFIIIRVCLPSFSKDKTEIGGVMVRVPFTWTTTTPLTMAIG